MQSLFWQLTNRTAESLLILNLFHLLLAGLTLLVLLHQIGVNRRNLGRADRLVTLGFFLLVVHFALLTLHFGASFFLRRSLELAGLERVSHGLLVAGVLVIVASYLDSADDHRFRWVVTAVPILLVLVLLDVSTKLSPLGASRPHSLAMLAEDLMGFLAALMGARAVGKCRWEGGRARRFALLALAIVFLLHGLPSFVSGTIGVVVWNAEEQIMSVALFSLTWAAGERSGNLLERVFVRLNLTFIILASLIMLSTAEMAKYQYLRLAEERSMSLAEVLRGHIIYFHGLGESVPQIFAHPEVLRRIVAEFGNSPELREIVASVDGQRVRFLYTADLEVKQAITPQSPQVSDAADQANSFSMVRLLIGDGRPPADYVEFIGTMDFVNAYIGKYLIFIYCIFTVIVIVATGIIGIIVHDTDQQLRRQYTELQEAQQQLAQAAKLASIGELAGGMAHEINNPITSILALSSYMAERENGESLSARGRKNLRLIAQQAERVSALVGGLLSFSRQTQLHLSDVNIGTLLNTAIDLVRYRLNDGRIQVRQRIEPALPSVNADESRLTEVFVNLLNNAIDSMPEGGALVLTAGFHPEDGAVRVQVQDSGHGIPPELLPRIFDPFFTTKAPGRGTGLGLSITHGIVKDHGGEIWARSEPGQGATFVVSLLAGANQYETTCSGD